MSKTKENMMQEQPYEKFQRFGAESLTEGELLAIILRTGTQEKSALMLANEVLSLGKYPRTGLLGLHDLSVEDICQIKGIGEVKAIKLKCLTELAMRFSRSTAKLGLNVREPSTIADYFMEKLRHRKTECVYLLCLDSKGLVIRECKLSEGSVNKALISPRDVFITALREEAVNVILVHNHPSGDPTPSGADVEITKSIDAMGINLDVPLLDHVIIGDKKYFSFRKENMLIRENG